MRRRFPFQENWQISERDNLGPPVVPGGQEIGLGSQNLRRLRAEARPTGRAVSCGCLFRVAYVSGQSGLCLGQGVPYVEPQTNLTVLAKHLHILVYVHSMLGAQGAAR